MGCETRVKLSPELSHKCLRKVYHNIYSQRDLRVLCSSLLCAHQPRSVSERTQSLLEACLKCDWVRVGPMGPPNGRWFSTMNPYESIIIPLKQFFERGQSFCIFDPDLATEFWIFVPPCSWKFRAGSFWAATPMNAGWQSKNQPENSIPKPHWERFSPWLFNTPAGHLAQ